MSAELTIIIPTKNEELMLPTLLRSLERQDYAAMREVRIVVADAGSTDRTRAVVGEFRGALRLEVIEGGLPARGRHAGALLATTPYVLFLDADVELDDPTLLRRALEAMRTKGLALLTVSIACRHGSFWDDALYAGNNLFQRVGAVLKPFATGMFMLFDRAEYLALGGFNEAALFAEDYLLSKRVPVRRFRILKGRVLTTNRRFRKLGHRSMVWMFFKTMLHSWNDAYFLRDQSYWTDVA